MKYLCLLVHDENYVRDKRMVLAMQYARFARLNKQGFTVVIATISLL